MLRAVCLLSLLLACPLFADDNLLVKPHDFWRVQPYTNGLVSSNWTQIGFDDSEWPLRQAAFVTATDFNAPRTELTALPEDVVTYCFRKKFEIADPANVGWLSLRIDYQSGFVAYLNGVEVARRGFPPSSGAIPPELPAEAHVRGFTEIVDLSAATAALGTGENILAIQLHSAGEEFPAMVMVAELVANFTRGPFLQNTTTNSVQIVWQTSTPTTGSVLYGKDLDHLSAAVTQISDTNHVVTLTNLEPSQTYQYRVYAESGAQAAATDWSTFRTFSMPGAPVMFLVFGDSGQATVGQYRIADQMKAQAGADLLFHVGDLVYGCYMNEHADARFFSVYRDQLRTTPFFAAQGNHEGYCGRLNEFYGAFSFPTNSATGTEEWYSFDHGDVHFIAVNADTETGHSYLPGSPQYNWLEADLAASRQRWKFIFFHHVIRSSSLHGVWDDFLGNGILDKYEIQAHIGSLASRYGAQVIFNGHDHDFERFATYEGYNSFVSGGGGASLYPQAFQEEGSVQFLMRHNFLKVTVDGPDLKVEAIDENGVVLDRFYRSQAPSAPASLVSTWGAPMIEGTSGADLAGNIPNQTFDFSGASISTRAGQRANLGRLHVRNDRDFVYLGLESVAIWPDQVIALFIENPAQPGVTDLAMLGNGALDWEYNGEGADGLDLLTNLMFRAFRPSIGCLLGDEKADGAARNFKRAGMRWGAGQGVFRLDQTFSTIARARLQQFDRSPQTPVPPFYNANADFIEMAIPLAALGISSSAPSQLKVGAIAFTDPVSGPATPRIDSAVLGAALDIDGNGVATLEPITISLAPDPDPFRDGFAFTATLISESQIRFDWNSVPGVAYTVLSSPALGQPFEEVVGRGSVVASGTSASSTILIEPNAPARFYRLRAD